MRGKLHAAAKELGVKVRVRRLDLSEVDTGFCFKVEDVAPAATAKGGAQ